MLMKYRQSGEIGRRDLRIVQIRWMAVTSRRGWMCHRCDTDRVNHLFLSFFYNRVFILRRSLSAHKTTSFNKRSQTVTNDHQRPPTTTNDHTPTGHTITTATVFSSIKPFS